MFPYVLRMSELLQRSPRKQASPVIPDLEDEKVTQESLDVSKVVREAQGTSKKLTVERKGEDSCRMKNGLVAPAGSAVTTQPEPASRGAGRAATPWYKVNIHKIRARRVTPLMGEHSYTTSIQDIPRPRTDLASETEDIVESGDKKETEEKIEQRAGEEKSKSEVQGKKCGKKSKLWMRIRCLLPFCSGGCNKKTK